MDVGDLGGESAGGSSGVGSRLPKLLLMPDCGLGQEAEELELKLIGGLVKMRILTSGEHNIWYIGFLQSVSKNPEKVIGVAVKVGDWLPGVDERDD